MDGGLEGGGRKGGREEGGGRREEGGRNLAEGSCRGALCGSWFLESSFPSICVWNDSLITFKSTDGNIAVFTGVVPSFNGIQ